jgi:hypothetical protein
MSLAEITLIHVPGRVEHWVRFGRHASERILDRRRRILYFRPNEVVAFVRWASNAFGTIESRIDIVRTVEPDAPYTTLPFVRPGAEPLLTACGWPRVETVLKLIDAAETIAGEGSAVAPAYWRHVHHSMAAGLKPGAYGRARHRSWQLHQDLHR